MFNKLKVAVFNAVSGTGDIDQSAHLGITDKGPDFEKPLKFKYKRPFFLSFTSDEEVQVSADHHSRPIIVPRDTSRLPWHSGYAEAVNAGKSIWNEDQAFLERRELRRVGDFTKPFPSFSVGTEMSLPYIYFALFDGHAGYGASVAAAHQLHNILHARLMDVVEQLLPRLEDIVETGRKGGVAMWVPDKDVDKEMLIKGALELAFHDMMPQNKEGKKRSKPHPAAITVAAKREQTDGLSVREAAKQYLVSRTTFLRYLAYQSANGNQDQLIMEDKKKYRMKGGCTALVALFILGKLFVANAGDSRAVLAKNDVAIPMSNDFTPESERGRVRQLAALKPELLGNDFTRLDYIRRPTTHDLGKKILYRDHYMTGWAYKVVTRDDLKYPVVVGEGKRSRVLGTIGVTRGFGDHDLRAVVADVPVKPFLSSQPEVKVFDIEEEDVTEWDALIMGTDGLWDVTTNENAIEIVQRNLAHFRTDMRAKFTSAAQDLIMQSRGKLVGDSWRTHEGRAGSIDDISVFVIPLLPYKKEYTEWRTMYDAAWGICEPDSQNNFGKLSLRTSPIPSQRQDTASNGASLSMHYQVTIVSDNTEKDIWDLDEDSEEVVVTQDIDPSTNCGIGVSGDYQQLSHHMGILDIKDVEVSDAKRAYQDKLYTDQPSDVLLNKDVDMQVSSTPHESQFMSFSTRQSDNIDSTLRDTDSGDKFRQTVPDVSCASGSGLLLSKETDQQIHERPDSQTLPAT